MLLSEARLEGLPPPEVHRVAWYPGFTAGTLTELFDRAATLPDEEGD